MWTALLLLLLLAASGHVTQGRPWDNVTRHLAGVNVKQLQRLQFIKLHILNSLGFSTQTSTEKGSGKAARVADVGRKRTGGLDASGGRGVDAANPQEIISLSEVVGEGNDGTVLQFKLQHPKPGQLQVVSAYLWVKVRKRGSSRRPRTVEIRVFQIEEEGQQSMLSYLRTRIKKTRWRQLSLPISLVQRLMESAQGSLQLKVECRRCGPLVRLVMPWSRKGRPRAKGRNRGKKRRGSAGNVHHHHHHRHPRLNGTEEWSGEGNSTSSSTSSGLSKGDESPSSGKTPSSQSITFQLATSARSGRGSFKGRRKNRKQARSLTSRRSRPKRPRRPYLVINAREK